MSEQPKGEGHKAEIVSLEARRKARSESLVGTRPLQEVVKENSERLKNPSVQRDGGKAWKDEADGRKTYWEAVGYLGNQKRKEEILDQITTLKHLSPPRVALSTPNRSSIAAQEPSEVLKYFANAGDPNPSGREKQKILEEFLQKNISPDPTYGRARFFLDPMTGMTFIEWTTL